METPLVLEPLLFGYWLEKPLPGEGGEDSCGAVSATAAC